MFAILCFCCLAVRRFDETRCVARSIGSVGVGSGLLWSVSLCVVSLSPTPTRALSFVVVRIRPFAAHLLCTRWELKARALRQLNGSGLSLPPEILNVGSYAGYRGHQIHAVTYQVFADGRRSALWMDMFNEMSGRLSQSRLHRNKCSSSDFLISIILIPAEKLDLSTSSRTQQHTSLTSRPELRIIENR